MSVWIVGWFENGIMLLCDCYGCWSYGRGRRSWDAEEQEEEINILLKKRGN